MAASKPTFRHWKLVGPPGFEPELSDSKSLVLPLHHGSIKSMVRLQHTYFQRRGLTHVMLEHLSHDVLTSRGFNWRDECDLMNPTVCDTSFPVARHAQIVAKLEPITNGFVYERSLSVRPEHTRSLAKWPLLPVTIGQPTVLQTIVQTSYTKQGYIKLCSTFHPAFWNHVVFWNLFVWNSISDPHGTKLRISWAVVFTLMRLAHLLPRWVRMGFT